MATQLLDVFGFLSVLLRGAALALNSLLWGGTFFLVVVLRPLPLDPELGAVWAGCRRLITWSAAGLVCAQLCFAAVDSAVLGATAGLSIHEIAGANYFVASMAVVVPAAVICVLSMNEKWRPGWGLVVLAGVALEALVNMSHAGARLENRPQLQSLTTVHQAATACWIGGIPYLLIAFGRVRARETSHAICRRFSRMAMVSVALLIASGLGMSLAYVGSPAALYGTAYGAMVVCKVMLLGALLFLGAINFLMIRRPSPFSAHMLETVRRFAEVEVGIGFTIILAAASLTSQPPAVDLTSDRLSVAEIAQRMRPRPPLLETPPLSALSPASPLGFDANSAKLVSFVPGASYQPSTPGDIAWSEYNHHWAGLIVLAAGVLAFAARAGVGAARHWPLSFLALAVFLFLRADPENWPLGPRSFWQSFSSAEVLQHRVFILLIVAFAAFEWAIRTGRIAESGASLVFPTVCAAGGALLLTHAHALGNIKEELLAELSHIPLAILAVVAGWSRWLELRLGGPTRRVSAWLWPVCFILIGCVLLNYRES